MGMSTHVIGIIPPDDRWKQMKAIWDTCAAALIKPPAQVEDFFGEYPDERGQLVEIQKLPCTQKHDTVEGEDGFEVDITKLPPHVKIVRFYNSY